MKAFFAKIPRLILILLLTVAIGLSARLQENFRQKDNNHLLQGKQLELPISELQKVYPTGVKMILSDTLLCQVLDAKSKVVGTAIYTGYVASTVKGFGGATPLYLLLNDKKQIAQIYMVENAETKEYLENIQRHRFLENWYGKTPKQALSLNIDAVSGCTFSSTALKKNIEMGISAYVQQQPLNDRISILSYVRGILSVGVVLFALLSFFFPHRFNNFRYLLLACSVIILGFWQGQVFSLERFYLWIVAGLSPASWFLLVLLVLSLLLPLFLNRSFYCIYVCPFGAAQELAGKIPSKKYPLPRKMANYLSHIRKLVLLICVFLALTGLVNEFSKVEVFAGFMPLSASSFSLVLFGTFLLLSVFFQKPWCRYFCPTGFLFELFRRPVLNKERTKENHCKLKERP
ncbi:MAG: 4Fe-4S binding protein [Bacteroidales bacterium]